MMQVRRRFIVLVRRDADEGAEAFEGRVIGAAHDVARTAGARDVAAYVPLGLAPKTRHGLPEPKRCEALITLEADRAEIALGAAAALGQSAVYRVEGRTLKARTEGARRPAVFLVSPVFRAPSLDREAFDAHWRDRHGPLALRHHAKMSEYRQDLVVETLTVGASDFDGIALLGFPSLEDFETGLFDSDEGRRAIGRDTARFVALESLETALLREVVPARP